MIKVKRTSKKHSFLLIIFNFLNLFIHLFIQVDLEEDLIILDDRTEKKIEKLQNHFYYQYKNKIV